ncbi:MAG: VPLPA-CTERM sorting domain-containing protein [Pseudomonadota bacterium]
MNSNCTFAAQLAATAFWLSAGSVHAATGTLAFQQSTDEWFSEVTVGIGDTFTVDFSPFGFSFVDEATGVFAPGLNLPIQDITTSTGEFEFISGDATSFVYALSKNLIFDFDNGVAVTFGAGTEFNGAFQGTSSNIVVFDMAENPIITFGDVGEQLNVVSAEFRFEESQPFFGGGFYNIEVSVAPVPLPATASMIAAAVGGLAIARRRRH